MEITLSLDRYTIMEQVSKQASEFRMADMYHLLKKLEPEKWQAKDVKITLEWLADMGLAKRKLLSGEHSNRCLLISMFFQLFFSSKSYCIGLYDRTSA